jgi:hypothetical protein
LYTNMREQIPDSIYRALEDAGMAGVFQAPAKNGAFSGMYFNPLHRMYKFSRNWVIRSPNDREAAQLLWEQAKPMIFIDRWLPRDFMILTLLHEFGHRISDQAGELSYPRPDWWHQADANVEKLKQSARASFEGCDYLSKDVGEITAESVGRLLAGIPLPACLENLARRVIRESGVRVSIPLFKMKVWKSKPSEVASALVPLSELPRSLQREAAKEVRQ